MVFKHVRLKKTRMSELNKLMIDQDKLINAVPERQREIKMLNIDNEIIRERIEEDMDFKKFQDYHILL